MADATPAFPIPSKLVEYILLGPADDQRQLQDSPILGDVWLAYAADPASIQDLLITPHKEATAADVASEISNRIAQIGRSKGRVKEARIAYLQGIVAARLYFDEVLRILVPVTQWWHERKIREKLQAYDSDAIRGRIGQILSPDAFLDARSQPPGIRETFTALDRYLTLAGLILWASRRQAPSRTKTTLPTVDEVLKKAKANVGAIVAGLLEVFAKIAGERSGGDSEKLIFQVSLNRRAMAALDKSVPAVKADAARTLFRVACNKITWAVLDSGIDSDHDAFKTAEGETRVRRTFDFTRIRELVSSDNSSISDRTTRRVAEGCRAQTGRRAQASGPIGAGCEGQASGQLGRG